ncbi:hypothetical protein ACETK8_03790 [Brevundimonas staleyi]|uniref:TonB C-terminal domain-containing protein n=1 Tax=Brevundimonas staleyi TaxID=74326 RepID=A0ABW0FVV9_9CAUL
MFATLAALALFADPTAVQPAFDRAPRQPEPTPVVSMAAAPAPMLQSVAVTLECTAFADGHIGECSVMEETHPGMGFGEAAIALMADATTDRSAADHRFARTIQFMP